MALSEIHKYMCFATARPTGGYREAIFLYDASGSRVADLRFTNDTISPPSEGAYGTYILYYTREEDADVLDMLRNEKPVYFWWGGEGNLSYLRTGREGVGEGETDPFED